MLFPGGGCCGGGRVARGRVVRVKGRRSGRMVRMVRVKSRVEGRVRMVEMRCRRWRQQGETLLVISHLLLRHPDSPLFLVCGNFSSATTMAGIRALTNTITRSLSCSSQSATCCTYLLHSRAAAAAAILRSQTLWLYWCPLRAGCRWACG